MRATAAPSERPPPNLLPGPGSYLVAGVTTALAGIAAGGDDRALTDELKTALARTAACGDTCRVRSAADTVRQAADLLVAGAVEDANEVLLRVLRELTGRRTHPTIGAPRQSR